ncbi:MAG: hypothetical protein JRI68_21105 [Deltaproteobacteria bacterium]|nr:hypothetical protein [Deltaproteobacteria bacterium]
MKDVGTSPVQTIRRRDRRAPGLALWVTLAGLATTPGCRSEVPADGPARPVASAPAPPTAIPTAAPSATAPPAPRAQSPLHLAIDRAAGYLTRACHLNGRFNYRINLDPDVTPKPSYNILRHAGAIYALASYQQRWPRPEIKGAILRATQYLQDGFIAPVPENGSLSAVWSDDVNKGLREAKLGGAGLALVALHGVEQIAPGTGDLAQQQAVGDFIIYLQKDDGSFYSKYFPEGRGRSDAWTSLYYPGEAALGLLLLRQRDPAGKWQDAAADALGYLARLRQGRTNVEPDHWALLATARLLDGWDSTELRGGLGVTRDQLIDHAAQICESMLRPGRPHPLGSPLHGSFGGDGRTTPVATRIEGMLAALTFLPERHGALRGRIRTAADGGIAFLLRAQVTEGPHRGAIPRAIERRVDQPADSPFNRRATEVRIDYVQHALSAWIQYLELPPEESR